MDIQSLEERRRRSRAVGLELCVCLSSVPAQIVAPITLLPGGAQLTKNTLFTIIKTSSGFTLTVNDTVFYGSCSNNTGVTLCNLCSLCVKLLPFLVHVKRGAA